MPSIEFFPETERLSTRFARSSKGGVPAGWAIYLPAAVIRDSPIVYRAAETSVLLAKRRYRSIGNRP